MTRRTWRPAPCRPCWRSDVDVVIYTSDEVSAEDAATALIEAGWYVHSVRVRSHSGVDYWEEG